MTERREPSVSPALRVDMEKKGIDITLTLSILSDLNAGLYDGAGTVKAAGIPQVASAASFAPGTGSIVLDLSPGNELLCVTLPAADAIRRLDELGLRPPEGVPVSGGVMRFDRSALEEIGFDLLPSTAFGILNGGSATSYADVKKNASLDPDAFALLRPEFDVLAPRCSGKPKGITPAYVNPDGSPGASFLELKMRALLLAGKRYAERRGKPARPVLPLFQMTSDATDAALRDAYAAYRDSPFLRGPATGTGFDPTRVLTANQPLMAAFTHSCEGNPKRIFDRAFGAPDSAIALPGGHGQSFRVLSDIYGALRDAGYRFTYLGNVDNVGSLPDPVEIAVLALSGAEAGFDFSYRTRVDVKGGILVVDDRGAMTVADIGPAISFDEVKRLEKAGQRVLFNCATGLFDLDKLVPRLPELARRLPVRVSDQDKDAGRYSQAEQVTWEAIGLLERFVGFGVSKCDRFVAAKLLMETVLTSGAGGQAAHERLAPGLAETSRALGEGLSRLLAGPYGLRLDRTAGRPGAWRPMD
ncbi:MAG: UTP--glucose-1-phosphate uridylyltransferase [Spirochaetes bacterium]|nr:UTP--glucose-1-phosphate uridylyltransferase [Spirochaetota bacterium]